MTAHRDNPCDFGTLSVTGCVVDDGGPGVRITIKGPAGEVVLSASDARRLQGCIMRAVDRGIDLAMREAQKRKRQDEEMSGV